MSTTVLQWIFKFFILVACAFLLGLPLIEPYKIAAYFFILAMVLLSPLQLCKKPWRYWLMALLAVGIMGKWLPQINIPEGHNLFLVDGTRHQILQQTLPKAVYEHGKSLFEHAYPESKQCDPQKVHAGCWRSSPELKKPFAYSADSASQTTKPSFSRDVPWIDFSTVLNFRGGFMGDHKQNWYEFNVNTLYDPIRKNMPFFVMYQIPKSLVGLNLCWRGHVFIEKTGAAPKAYIKKARYCKKITTDLVNAKIYGLHILPSQPLYIKLSTRLTLAALSQLGHNLFTLMGALSLALLFFYSPYKPWAGLLFTVFTSFAVLHFFYPNNMPSLFYHLSLHGGGDELTHWGFGRTILENFIQGNWSQALKGVENVFYFMPGYRYFHALEAFSLEKAPH